MLSFSSLRSVASSRFSFQTLPVSAAAVMMLAAWSAPAQQRVAIQAGVQRPLTQTLTGATPELMTLMQAQRAAISVAVADFDRDGAKDLVTGYVAGNGYAVTLQRGVAAAIAPTGADWTAFTQGMLSEPFAEAAEITAVPVRPDVLLAVDVNGDGALDLLVAAKGDSSAYVLLGNGKGGFAAPSAIVLGGNVTALSTFRAPDATSNFVASVCNTTGCNLRVLGHDGAAISSFTLPAPALSIVVASVNGSGVEDVAVVAGGKVLLFDGAAMRRGQASIDTLPAQYAAAIATGNFVYDRRGFPQVAVVDASGTLHVFARSGLDSTVPTSADKVAMLKKLNAFHLAHNDPSLNPYAGRPTVHAGMAWSEVETLAQAAAPSHADSPMILLPGRFSGSGSDDLAVASSGSFNKVVSASQTNGTTRTTRAAVSSMATSGASSNTVLSAVAARVSPDALSGTIIADGRPQAYVTMPTNHPHTYTVNSTVDGAPTASCSPTCNLRTAVHLVNADTAVTGSNGLSAVDIIIVPAGTYSLTYNEGLDTQSDLGYRLPIDGGVSIVGNGVGSTIIDAGNHDKVMSLNEGIVNVPGSFDIFLSGLQLQNGKNTNPGAGIPNGGIVDWDNNGTGNLTITNSLITAGTANTGPGGGIGVTNYAQTYGSGTLDIESSTISASSTPEGGGGLFLGENVPLTMNNSTVTGNSANVNLNPADKLGYGEGGGIIFYSDATFASTAIPVTQGQLFITAAQIAISNSTISSNKGVSSGGGGGGLEAQEPFTLSNTTFNGNSATLRGGGLEATVLLPSSITGSTFTSNTITSGSGGYGAAVVMDAGVTGTNALTLSYSRFSKNSAPGNTTDGAVAIIDDAAGSEGATINAANNWWGCNPTTAVNSAANAVGGSNCDTAGIQNGTSTFALLTVVPYTVLKFTSASTSVADGGSLSFTAGLAQNSAGTAYSGAQDTDLAGDAATLVIAQKDGTTTNSSASTLSATDTISTTATADTNTSDAGTNGGVATVTVDGFSVTSKFTVVEPPTAALGFSPTSIGVGGTSALTITLSNPNVSDASGNDGTALSGLAFTNTLPAGVTVAATPGVTSTCGGTATAVAGSGTISLSGGALTAPTSTTATTCTVTVNVTSTTQGTFTDTASASVTTYGASNTASASLTVNPGNAAKFTVSGYPSPTTAGVAHNVTVTASDSYGNTATGYTGTVHFTSSDTNATLPANYTFVSSDHGSHTFNATLQTAGSQSITATDTVTTSITGSQTGIIVNGGGATRLTVTGSSTTAAGNGYSVTVTALDSFGNVANSYSGTVHFSSSDPIATLPADSTLVNGVGGFSATLKTTGSQSVSATDTVTSAITGSKTGITVTPGTAASFVVTGLGPFAAPGTAGSASVRVLDAFNNTVTNFTGTVTLTSTDTSATLPSPYTFTVSDNGVHSFSVTLNTAGTYSVTATSTPISGSETGIVVQDAIWVLNTNSKLARLTDAGTQTTTAGAVAGTSSAGAVAFDQAGNVWVAESANNTVQVYSASGATITATGPSGAGISAPAGLAIDGAGYVWIANGNGTVSVLSSPTAAVTGSTGYQQGTGNINAPVAITIDGSGSVWIANKNNSVTQIIGGAAPVVTPTVTGTTNNTLGTKP